MPSRYELRCDHCDFAQDYLWASLFYYFGLDDDFWVPMNCDIAWCAVCRRVVTAERFLSHEELDDEFTRAGSGGRYARGWWGEAGYWWRLRQHLIDEQGPIDAPTYAAAVNRLRVWRTTRVAPPRCLSCGEGNIRPIEIDKEFAHPGYAGSVRTVNFLLVSSEGDARLFDSEGLPIRDA
jgi:hypothetical protein